MERYKHDMKAALNKRYIIFGMTGCLCFGMGDWLLGYVEPTLTGGDVFYFIRAGHGVDYDMAKSVVTLILMIIGICFLYPGLLHISEIANDEKTKRQLKYACGLCSFGWLTLHMNVTLNVIAFSSADTREGRIEWCVDRNRYIYVEAGDMQQTRYLHFICQQAAHCSVGRFTY